MHAQWSGCLFEKYKWIATTELSLVEIVKKLIQDCGDDVECVYDSSVWAVCMAYLDYKERTNYLTPQDLLYTRSRGGILGLKVIDNNIVTITIRQYIQERDFGFYDFTWNLRYAPAA